MESKRKENATGSNIADRFQILGAPYGLGCENAILGGRRTFKVLDADSGLIY